MHIKSAKSFRYWYKTKIKEIDNQDQIHNENFVGTYHKEKGKKTIATLLVKKPSAKNKPE